MSRTDDLRDANRAPLDLLRQAVYIDTFDVEDAPEFSVVCLPTDSFHSVLERARKYPGWVEVLVHFGTRRYPGGRRVDVDSRQILPKQFDIASEKLHRMMTVGDAFEILRMLEVKGIDIFGSHGGLTNDQVSFARELAGSAR